MGQASGTYADPTEPAPRSRLALRSTSSKISSDRSVPQHRAGKGKENQSVPREHVDPKMHEAQGQRGAEEPRPLADTKMHEAQEEEGVPGASQRQVSVDGAPHLLSQIGVDLVEITKDSKATINISINVNYPDPTAVHPSRRGQEVEEEGVQKPSAAPPKKATMSVSSSSIAHDNIPPINMAGNLIGPLKLVANNNDASAFSIRAAGGLVNVGEIHGTKLIYKEVQDPHSYLNHLVWILNPEKRMAYPLYGAGEIAQLKFNHGTPDVIKPDRIYFNNTSDYFVFLGHAEPKCFVKETDLKDRNANAANRFLVGGIPYESKRQPNKTRVYTRVGSDEDDSS